jgi:hypothetical protein
LYNGSVARIHAREIEAQLRRSAEEGEEGIPQFADQRNID